MIKLRLIIMLAIMPIFLLACEHKDKNTITEQRPVDVPAEAAVKPQLQDPRNFNPADQKACVDFGGTYQQAGLLGAYNCFVDYDDGGKTCSDASDCQGRCFATFAHSYDPDAPGGHTGTCAANDSPFGCRSEIVEGVVQPGLCVD